MNNRIAIFIDFDGTLYDNKEKFIPKSTIETLYKYHDKYDLFLSTGRAKFVLGQLEEVKTLFTTTTGLTMASVQSPENPISFCGKDFTIKNKNIFMRNCEIVSFKQVDANKVKVRVRTNKGDVLIRYSNKEINEMDGFEQLKQLSLS